MRPRVRAILNRFAFIVPPVPWYAKSVGWMLVYPDEVGFTLLAGGLLEQRERLFMSRYLRPGMTVVDAGANQGIYALLAARLVRPGGRVVAFEPSPTEFRKLVRNIKMNRLRNVTPEEVALGPRQDTVALYEMLDGKGAYSSLRFPEVSARHRIVEVKMTTLDQYVAARKFASIDFIKLDVEGAELPVLRGGNDTLLRWRPVIQCEMADTRTRPWGYHASDTYDHLAELHYVWCSVSSSGQLTPAERRQRYEPDWANLVAVPAERLADVSLPPSESA